MALFLCGIALRIAFMHCWFTHRFYVRQVVSYRFYVRQVGGNQTIPFDNSGTLFLSVVFFEYIVLLLI